MTSKLFWLLALLVLAVVTVKPLRDRVAGHMEPALNPVYEWDTRNRVHDLQRLTARETSTGGQLPRPRDFEGFITRLEGAGAAKDSWGQPYYLTVTKRTYQVGSSGRDRVRGTSDDIVSAPAPRPAAGR
jgi:hypothetical protein